MHAIRWAEAAWAAAGVHRPESLEWYRAILSARPADVPRSQRATLLCAILDTLDVQASVVYIGTPRRAFVAAPMREGSRGGWGTLDVDAQHVYIDGDGRGVHPDDLRGCPDWAANEHPDVPRGEAARQADVKFWRAERDGAGGRHETLIVERAIVTHDATWRLWPDTDKTDYTDVLAQRWQEHHVDPETGRTLIINNRLWPAFLGYLRANKEPPYMYPPHLDNSEWPSEAVTQQQIRGLEELSADGVKIVHWMHGFGCHPPTAKALRSLFPLSVLQFADDAPGSSEKKVLPVAGFFDIYYHAMRLMDFETGASVADRYRILGTRPIFAPSNPSAGVIEAARTQRFAFARRIAAMRAGVSFDYNCVFVGARSGNAWRDALLRELDTRRMPHFYIAGTGSRRGRLEPFGGALLVPLYQRALMGLNPQWTSLFNTRLMDYWYLGLPQLIYDPHEELAAEGLGSELYIPYDGTVDDLRRAVIDHGADRKRLTDIAVAGRLASTAYRRDKAQGLARVYFENWRRLR